MLLQLPILSGHAPEGRKSCSYASEQGRYWAVKRRMQGSGWKRDKTCLVPEDTSIAQNK